MAQGMTRAAPLFGTLLATLLTFPAALGGLVPCSDFRGCPDLIVDAASMTPTPSVEFFSESDCAVVEGMVEPGWRTLVRFNFVSPNVGRGNLYVGDPEDHLDWFTYSDCHEHYHFNDYADYRLWTLEDFQVWDAYREANPNATPVQALAATGLSPVEGRKQGFCVIDVLPYPIPPGDPIPRYLFCDDQGITRGWADMYHLSLDGQWVDVTDVPPGLYVLEAEVNAERVYTEESYANNRASVPIVV